MLSSEIIHESSTCPSPTFWFLLMTSIAWGLPLLLKGKGKCAVEAQPVHCVSGGFPYRSERGNIQVRSFVLVIFFSFVHIKLVKLPGLLLLKLSVHLDRDLIRRNLNSRLAMAYFRVTNTCNFFP